MPYSREQFVEDYYGALPRMAAIGQHFQGQRDSQQMAEMAAGRFEALGGDQAGYWANQIRRNPRAAIQLAEQYGGLGAIEQSLQSARAQAQADAALRSAMTGQSRDSQQPGDKQTSIETSGNVLTPAQLEVFIQDGPEGLTKYIAALRDAEKLKRDRAIWGDASDSGVSGSALDRARLAAAIDSDDPSKIAAEQSRRAYGVEWDYGALDTIRKNWQAQLAPIADITYQWGRLDDLQTDDRLDVLEMIQMWQKNVDEGAVVREGDIELVKQATSAGFENVFDYVVSFYDENKGLPEGIGSNVKESLRNQLSRKAAVASESADEMESFANRNGWSDKARRRAIPYIEQIEAARKIARSKDSRRTETPEQSDVRRRVESTAVGDVIDLGEKGLWRRVGQDTVERVR